MRLTAAFGLVSIRDVQGGRWGEWDWKIGTLGGKGEKHGGKGGKHGETYTLTHTHLFDLSSLPTPYPGLSRAETNERNETDAAGIEDDNHGSKIVGILTLARMDKICCLASSGVNTSPGLFYLFAFVEKWPPFFSV